MKNEKKEKLRKWFESLDHEKQIDIALECIEELILTEYINFYESTTVPFWDASGERLDGTRLEDNY